MGNWCFWVTKPFHHYTNGSMEIGFGMYDVPSVKEKDAVESKPVERKSGGLYRMTCRKIHKSIETSVVHFILLCL